MKKLIVNKQDFMQKVDALRVNRFDHPFSYEKLSLIADFDFISCYEEESIEIDSDVLSKLSELFLVSDSYFLNKSNFFSSIPEFLMFDDLTNKILTCFVSSREIVVELPSSILPHEIFSISIFEILDWQWLYPNFFSDKDNSFDKINHQNLLLFTTNKSSVKLSDHIDIAFHLHYDVVKKQCLISRLWRGSLTWFILIRDKPLLNNVNSSDLILLGTAISLDIKEVELWRKSTISK